MIEIGDGRSTVEATDRVSGSQPKQAPTDWVQKVAQPTQKTFADADDVRGAVQLIDGERGVAQALSIQGAFAVWSELRARDDSEAAPETARAAAEVLAGLIGSANSHAQDLFAEVKTGVGSAFFA